MSSSITVLGPYQAPTVYKKDAEEIPLPSHLRFLNVIDFQYLFSRLELPYDNVTQFKIFDYISSLKIVYIVFRDKVIRCKPNAFNALVKILSAGNKTYEEGEIPDFDENNENRFNLLINMIKDTDNYDLVIAPYCGIEVLPDSFCELAGNSFTTGKEIQVVDSKMDGLYNLILNQMEGFGKALQNVSDLYIRDKDKPKLYDALITFNTTAHGKDTRFFLSLDKLLPVNNTKEYRLERRPITDEDEEYLFGYPTKEYNKVIKTDFKLKEVIEAETSQITYVDSINSRLDKINNGIKDFFNSNPKSDPWLEAYLAKRFDSVIIPIMVQIDLRPFALFGGNDDFRLQCKEPSANVLACNEIIDKEVMKIIEWLRTLPVEAEGVEYFAIDTDGFGVYGMNDKDIPIYTVGNPKFQFINVFQDYYSRGFTEILKYRLKESKAKYFFTHKGTKIKKEEPKQVVDVKFDK